MNEPHRVHIEALNLRLKNHDQTAATALVRDLPTAFARRLEGSGKTVPGNLAEEVAEEVASRIRSHMKGEG